MIDRSTGRRVLHLVAVVVVVSLVLVVVVNAVPQLVGADESYVVLSGSMEPQIGVGDSVIVKHVDPADIGVGDVVTFRADGQSNPTTHRVVDVIEDGESLSFLTKGDANEEADPRPITESELIGRVLVTIPFIGYLFTFLDTPLGYVLFIGVPFGLLVLSELWSLAASNRDGSTSPPDTGADPATPESADGSEPDAGGSGLTITKRDLRVLLPVTVLFGIYTVWNALRSPGSMVHVGVAAALVLLSVFLGVLYISLGGGETEPVSRDGARPTVGIHIDGDDEGFVEYDGMDATRVSSVRELTAVAREEELPIVVDEGLRWYRVRDDTDTYLYDGAGVDRAQSVDGVMGEPLAGTGGASHADEGNK